METELSKLLQRMREDFLAGKHRMGQLYFHNEALADHCDDPKTVAAAIKLLDESSPGGNFHIFIDGGQMLDTGDAIDFVYRYDRRPAEIAAVIGKAIIRAKAMAA